MANNGFNMHYQQRPPPQRENYYGESYDDRQYRSDPPREAYQQHRQEYGGFAQNQNYQNRGEHDYGNSNRWEDASYQDGYYQEEYTQNVQQYGTDQMPQRNYQYDERYRTNVHNRPPAQNLRVDSRTQNGQYYDSPIENRTFGVETPNGKQPKVRERILKDPDSPKTSSWDNPFPTFPSKKSKPDLKKVDPDERPKAGTPITRQSEDSQRPSTSHSARPRIDSHRPPTSQSQRQGGPHNQFPVSNNPLHRGPPPPQAQRNIDQRATAGNVRTRPHPQRAMTGPAPQRPTDFDYVDQQYQSPQFDSASHRAPNNYPANQFYDQAENESGFVRRDESQLSSTASYEGPRHQRHASDLASRQQQSRGFQPYDSPSYRGVPLAKKPSPEMPNFDAISTNMNEAVEDHLTPSAQQPGQMPLYKKPTYYQPNSNGSDSRKQQARADANELVTPLAQFSFELPGSEPPNHFSPGQSDPQYRNQQFVSQQYPESYSSPISHQAQQAQYPVRSASQPQELPANGPQVYPGDKYLPKYDARPPVRPGLSQIPSANRREQEGHRNHGYDNSGYDPSQTPNADYGRSDLPQPQDPYQNDKSRQGYDTRLQPRPGYISPPQQQPPQPYRTAPVRSNTSGVVTAQPASDRAVRPNSDGYSKDGIQNPDSLPAHPAPFRPGLIQSPPPLQQVPHPPPPPPPPQPHNRNPSGANVSPDSQPPVTIRELNTLREDYKNRPNDNALGLRFAKRLVEAARVLASENGRADPKQTAKNRERYIFDGHKIIKRLCGLGYPEAMFYLADCYGQGMLGLESDPKEAFSLYQSAAKLGHAQAAYRVAVCCELGNEEGGGTRRDPLKAVQWYKRAASLGDTPAMYKMGMIQLKGLLGQQKNPREAISWLKRAAERANTDNPHALHELGLLYENAQPTDVIIKDEQYALQLFQQAAELGYKYSQFRLGTAYEYGLLGLPIDPRTSMAWYSRAAKQGEHQSEFALSGWYLTGSGQTGPGEQPLLQQSDTEAYLWARKAATSGLAKAEYAMGYYTEVGIGVTPNLEEAKRWYYRAAAQNHPKARERLEDLKKGGQRMQKTRVSRSNVGKHNEGECSVM